MKWIFSFFLFTSIVIQSQTLPEGFSYVKDIDPTILRELRYCNHNNFIGIPVNGYNDDILITSTLTAKALKKVQIELTKKGYSLKVFDAYRPQTAVNHFVKWARVINDTLMKQQYYPNLNKRHLFKLGYIASKSGHSRGSSVDLTIVNLKTGKELDMGSPYDFFGISSHITFQKLTKKQKRNRSFLQQSMKKFGFRPYKNEWWHFTLRNEPFPNTYFDFPIE
ncbi:M15 family metallopeptidase [Tenacibaculum halocynthiae]|uniref:M15 family metallopeptidase n=1 Tax=Tenacibaculum halocynthiae TaxID=1254437 RepID=UPI003D6524AE